jgi:pimeloyl-ACP methyl ester carboxylesterase
MLAALSVAGASCGAGHAAGAPTTGAPVPATTTPAPATTGPPATAAPATTEPPATTAAPATTSTTRPAGPPYPVTEQVLALVDHSRPTVSHGRTISAVRALTTDVWVPRAPGRLPLVVFAHGFDAGPATYAALIEAWAAHGYIVAAPEFPLTDPAVAGPNLDESDLDHQAADVRFVADWLVGPSSPLAAGIDRGRVAIAGHSDGGETVLAAAETLPPSGQPDFRAVIAMSAQVIPGAESPYLPMLVTQGDADTINPPALGYQLYDSARTPKYMLILHGGGHLPPLEAGSAWLPGIEAVSQAFLDAYVAGTGPVPAISAAAAAHPLETLRADP